MDGDEVVQAYIQYHYKMILGSHSRDEKISADLSVRNRKDKPAYALKSVTQKHTRV